jgi:diguanylate cyclase (GGDEF)-like protein
MKHRFAFLLAEFLYLRIGLIGTQLEQLFNQNDEEAFLFVGKPLNSPQALQRNENIILNLARSRQFDGVLSFSNSLNAYNGQKILNDYLKKCNKSKIVSIGDTVLGCSSIKLDNYYSIQLTVNHLFEHGLRKFVYISGPLNNLDAVERLKGVKDYLSKKNIELEAFYEGDFSYECGHKTVMDYFEKGLKLPEAFICANDEMAIGAYSALVAHGINVPQEVKLVGFDDNDKGKHLDSPLTTINQGFFDMVLAGLDIIRDGTVQDVTLSGKLIIRESCGCESLIKEASQEYTEKKYFIEKFQQLNQVFLDNLELQAQLSIISTQHQLSSQLKSLFANYQDFEFHVCLHKNGPVNIGDPLEFTFSEKMNCFLSLNNGEFCENIEFNRDDILPTSIREKTKTRVFFVYPLRMADVSYGYIVCNTSTAQDHRFVSLKDLLNISLSRIQMQQQIDSYKLELENLSYKDSLTKSYNHRGFHHFSEPRFKESISKGLTPTIVYADVDYLKLINDTYGHASGDTIIVAASDLLNSYFSNEIVARIGGDEFIVFIEDFSKYDLENLKYELNELMIKKSDEINKEFNFKMSFGFCNYDETRHTNLDDMIKEADKALYDDRRLSNHYYTSPNISRKSLKVKS